MTRLADTRVAETPPIGEERPVDEVMPHPHGAEVPTLADDEYQALKADIQERGLLVPLEVTAEGQLLDGRARLRAARELGRPTVPVTVIEPRDELEHILLAALKRRHLDPSQRAALALKLVSFEDLAAAAKDRQRANLRHGADSPVRASSPAREDEPGEATLLTREGEPDGATLPARDEAAEGRTRDRVAKLAAVSGRTVQDAITVQQNSPQLFEQVLRGERKAHSAASQIRRQLRDAAIGTAPPLPNGPFELILADPPWSFGSPDSDFAPEQHYPTMPIGDIKAMNVPAADDCLLFLWAVNSLLPEALEVIRAWGFRYRNNLAWIKPSIGPGVWLRQRHELLLIATRGSAGPPDPEERVDSVIEAPRTHHSAKPLETYDRIERMYPHLGKLELFARNTRPGWTSWGNQAPDPAEDQSAS